MQGPLFLCFGKEPGEGFVQVVKQSMAPETKVAGAVWKNKQKGIGLTAQRKCGYLRDEKLIS